MLYPFFSGCYIQCCRLVSVTDPEGTTNYYYDANGNRVSTEYPNGVTTTYSYNSINVLVSEVTTDPDENVIASYEYTIGSNGERLSCTELGRTVEYTYDALERLTSETVTVGSDVSVTTYTYDANSNRLSMNKDGEVTNYSYNSLNQILEAGDTSYTWDNAGNLVSQSRNGVIAATYTYDCHNRMISADINSISGNIVESYTYDYLGNRTSKTTNGETTYFTTDLSSGYSQVLKAETSSETIYYTRGFELISRRVGADAHYYLFDGGMSVRGLTDESGIITDTFVFDAFGNETSRTETTDNSYGFQGEEQDATGLYYLRARYMDPSTGTFTSMDTYAGSLSDPMSLHKYLFANSNPVKYCDPSGHKTLGELNMTVAIITVLAEVSSAIVYSMIGDIYGVDKTQPSYWAGMFATMIIAAFLAYWVAGAFVAGVTLCCTGKILLGIMGLMTGNICYRLSNIARMNGFNLYADIFEFAGFILQYYSLLELLQGIVEGIESIRDRIRSGGSDNPMGNQGSNTNQPRNPYGRRGGPAHQEGIDNIRPFNSENDIQYEYGFNTEGGYRNTRYADAVELDSDGNVVNIFQVGRVSGNGLPVARESQAIEDIMNSNDYNDYNGAPIYFIPYNSDTGPIIYTP